METSSSTIESLFERMESYVKVTFELSKLKSLETTSVVATSLISSLIVIFVFCLFALILNIGVALWLGELLSKTYYGFFIVAAFYFVVGIMLHFYLHKWIKKPLSDLIIEQTLQ